MSGIEENVQLGDKPTPSSGKLIVINQQPVMECSLDILTELVRHKTVTLRAKGESIPVAVAVANVVTENMLKGNSKILDIVVDSESQGINGPLVSVIEITIRKTN
ncbi:MAG TPA: DNA-binding protein [Candidatus Nitrosotalea sp.]|nr:DNA-binding protein [Candidatus Nitrosotalea sp.]